MYQEQQEWTTEFVSGTAWATYYDDQGYPYYYNHDTGESTYEYPSV